jgi:thiamine biosynthesis lipoprotein ApbE
MYATSDYEKPLTIYLEHPSEPGTYIAETSLMNQGFAASSTHKRRWKVSGKEYSHIINTAQTEAGIAIDEFGIYTKAPTAVLADAWSTTLLISKPGEHKEALTLANVSFALFNSTNSTLQKSLSF